MSDVAEQPLSPQGRIAPRKYVSGRGVLAKLGKYVGELGHDALVIAETRWF